MESTDHILLSCTYFDMVWKSTCLWGTMSPSTNLSFVDVADQIMQRKNDLEIAIFFTTSWMIWKKRNEAHYSTPHPDPSFLARFAAAHAIEYLEANYGSLSLVCKIVLFSLAFLVVILHLAAVFVRCRESSIASSSFFGSPCCCLVFVQFYSFFE